MKSRPFGAFIVRRDLNARERGIVMTSNRPYLIRAVYDWLIDNNKEPRLLVNALADQVEVPQQFVTDGRIVLNIAPHAVRNLSLDNDMIAFSARFAGVSTEVFIPPAAVLGIYSHDNGIGMLFPEDMEESAADSATDSNDYVDDTDDLDLDEQNVEKPSPIEPSPKGGKPRLTVVK